MLAVPQEETVDWWCPPPSRTPFYLIRKARNLNARFAQLNQWCTLLLCFSYHVSSREKLFGVHRKRNVFLRLKWYTKRSRLLGPQYEQTKNLEKRKGPREKKTICNEITVFMVGTFSFLLLGSEIIKPRNSSWELHPRWRKACMSLLES